MWYSCASITDDLDTHTLSTTIKNLCPKLKDQLPFATIATPTKLSLCMRAATIPFNKHTPPLTNVQGGQRLILIKERGYILCTFDCVKGDT
jgi:hypothetical protein